IFIPKGPWANVVVSPETYCCSDPTYKGIKATVEKSDKEVLLMADLMRDVYKKYVKEGEETEELPSLGESPVYKKIRSQ
ncbi:MAG TPA: formylmethanofuran dehydrogenase, partial [Methanobacterium sp.]|nr:formylmethanofuran dehydrogenase [Methanobacterium sp.]